MPATADVNPFEQLQQLHYSILSQAFLIEEVLASNIDVALVQSGLCDVAAEIVRMAEKCVHLLPSVSLVSETVNRPLSSPDRNGDTTKGGR